MFAITACLVQLRQRLFEPNHHMPTYCLEDEVNNLIGVGLCDLRFTTFTFSMIMPSIALLVQIELDPPIIQSSMVS